MRHASSRPSSSCRTAPSTPRSYTAQTVSDITQAVALLPNGQFLLAGSERGGDVHRQRPTLDTTFGTADPPSSISAAPSPSSPRSRSTRPAASSWRAMPSSRASGPDEMAVARLTANGALDTTLRQRRIDAGRHGRNGGSVTSLVVQADDKTGRGRPRHHTRAIAVPGRTGAPDRRRRARPHVRRQRHLPADAHPRQRRHDQRRSCSSRTTAELVALTGLGPATCGSRDSPWPIGRPPCRPPPTETVTDNDPAPPVANNDSYTADENTAAVRRPARRAGQRHRPEPRRDDRRARRQALPRHALAQWQRLVHLYPGDQLHRHR